MREAQSLCVVAMIFAALLAVDVGAADIKARAIKISYGTAEDHPFGLGVNKFAELVGGKSNGLMRAKGFSGGQLGAEVPSLASAQGGVIEMTVTSGSSVVGIVKDFALFDLPYLFTNEKEADVLLDGPVGKALLDKLPDKGLIGLCYWESGFRNLTNSKRPIAKVDDVQGLKIRTIQNPVFLDTMNALGANAVPMPFTELYTALETKAIDGQEGPYATIYTSKLYEVQKYLSPTQHIYGVVVVIVGKKFWDQLSGDERKILQDSCIEARDYERKINREMGPKALAELKAKGLIFTDIAPDEMAKFRARVKPVVDKHAKEINPDLVKQAYAAIEAVRKQK
jgi:tripartite ATP-independent transporter DctP family solute receptor